MPKIISPGRRRNLPVQGIRLHVPNEAAVGKSNPDATINIAPLAAASDEFLRDRFAVALAALRITEGRWVSGAGAHDALTKLRSPRHRAAGESFLAKDSVTKIHHAHTALR